MKFSNKKKAKMRKINQRRINKVCKNVTGITVDYDNNSRVIDQIKLKNVIYLLAKSENGEFAIYKLVKVYEYVKLSEKKILENLKDFSDYKLWNNKSTIQFNSEGKIESVKKTVCRYDYENDKLIPKYVTEDIE